MSVSVNNTTWLIGHCEATVEQLVNLFGQPVKLINHTSWSDGKIPYEWRLGFLNCTIYPYKFAPEDGRKVYKFSIGGTSTGQVIALQSFLNHVSKMDMWAEHPNCLDCPALGVQVSVWGDCE